MSVKYLLRFEYATDMDSYWSLVAERRWWIFYCQRVLSFALPSRIADRALRDARAKQEAGYVG